LVTPLRPGDVDLDAYEGLVDFQIENSSHGALVNDTTAEPSTLTRAEPNPLVDVAMRAARGRVPVIPATGSQSLAEAEIPRHGLPVGIQHNAQARTLCRNPA
jgi:4-hydroxy-tetrahydrodipicolinate synthase